MNVKTSLLRACINNHNVESALAGFESMKAGGGTCADARTYNVIAWGCARAGRIRQATHLVAEAYGLFMSKRMLPPRQDLSVETWEILLKALEALA